MKSNKILITKSDRVRLTPLLEKQSQSNPITTKLADKISRAFVVYPIGVPNDLVTMNTMLRVNKSQNAHLNPETVSVLRLVYPNQAESSEECVSILSQLGVELFGLREGDTFSLLNSSGWAEELTIEEIIYQPEAVGDWHL